MEGLVAKVYPKEGRRHSQTQRQLMSSEDLENFVVANKARNSRKQEKKGGSQLLPELQLFCYGADKVPGVVVSGDEVVNHVDRGIDKARR